MDVFVNRFPLVSNRILDLLDDTTLMHCKEVSKELNNFLQNEKSVWLRIIRLYKGNIIGFEDSWKKTIEKDSVDNIKHLALATQNFFKHESNFFMNQWHPLFIAAAEGSIEFCKYVLQKTGDNNPSIDNHINRFPTATGYTVLHFVAEFGCVDVARLIINRLEDKNPIDSHKNTCLHFAARNHDITVYKFFMKNAENKMPENFLGWTPCHQAAYSGNLKVLELVFKNLENKNPPTTKGIGNLGLTPLHIAAQQNHVNICRLILKNTSEKNPPKEDSLTPLHIAAFCGNLEAFKVLMKESDDKTPIDNGGGTPACYAIQNKHEKIIQYLKKDNLRKNTGWLTRVQKKFSIGWLCVKP